ncbi:2-hydroxyacyl-CoA dehydratase subunit D [Nocardia sp. CA-290969]|uniref:2-hydroxyacyl-CoA dehydratase subunit D n=1 Tax=Nocardia sp. CA-290969 TaxID=3239986 RepID=UPI003D91D3FE
MTERVEPPTDALATAWTVPELAARRHHDSGGVVVGYVSNNVPRELIAAAGAFAFEVRGAPDRSPVAGDTYMEDFHDGHVRSIFSRILEGDFDFLDLLVIPRSTEAYLQLYYYLLEARKWEPDRRFPAIHLFDVLQTPFWHSGRYVRAQVEALRHRIGELSGRPVGENDLRSGIETVNRSRRSLRELNDMRRNRPDVVSGSDLLRTARAVGGMDPREHADAVDALVRERGAAPANGRTHGPRIMVKGTQHDSLEVYTVLEELGASIVADDHPTGERAFDHTIEVGDGGPIEALTHHYQFDSPSARSYPQSRQDEIFMHMVADAGVDGVVFFLEENDDTLGWDYPAQKKLLDEAGVHSCYLPYQPYFQPDTQRLRTALAPFVESLAAGTAGTTTAFDPEEMTA